MHEHLRTSDIIVTQSSKLILGTLGGILQAPCDSPDRPKDTINQVIAYTSSTAKAKAVSSRTEGSASEDEVSGRRVGWCAFSVPEMYISDREAIKAGSTCFPHRSIAETRVVSRGRG